MCSTKWAITKSAPRRVLGLLKVQDEDRGEMKPEMKKQSLQSGKSEIVCRFVGSPRGDEIFPSVVATVGFVLAVAFL